MKTSPPFNLRILQAAADKMSATGRPVTIHKLTASDGTPLAVYQYRPERPKASLVFFHGGGAHAGAGYQLLSHGLAESFDIAVYMPDLRGHGKSGGDRGDAPSREQVWNDIDTVLDYALDPLDTESSLFIGGHSSGGGLVLNYLTENRGPGGEQPSPLNDRRLKGCVLVSPQLGYKAGIDRPLKDNQAAFARVNVLPFIGNGIFGWWGHNHAVQFTYPDDVLENDPGMVRSNTVNMANAITPVAPQKQLDDIKLPLKLWIGEADEIFLPEKVASFAQDKPNMSSELLPDETHLGILVNIHKQLGPWIHSQL